MALSSSQNKRHDANIKGLIYGMHEPTVHELRCDCEQ